MVYLLLRIFECGSCFWGKEEEVGVMIHHILFQCSLFLEIFNVNEVAFNISKMFYKARFLY